MTDILSLTPEELKEQIVSLGQPAFRAKQISNWLKAGVRDNKQRQLQNQRNAGTAVQPDSARAPQGTDFRTGRNRKIPVGPSGRQLCRDGSDALSLRQFRLHLQPGRLPTGLRFLRLNDRGADPLADGG